MFNIGDKIRCRCGCNTIGVVKEIRYIDVLTYIITNSSNPSIIHIKEKNAYLIEEEEII
jgi:hypothetical protein